GLREMWLEGFRTATRGLRPAMVDGSTRRKFRWGEVDGVPTVRAERGVVQGPLQACLLFGVGRSDEAVAVSGISHVVEHLALQALGRKPYILNGQVGPVSTRFLAMGGPEQVVDYFACVAER